MADYEARKCATNPKENPFLDLVPLRAKTILFFQTIGSGKEDINKWELFPLLHKLRNFIGTMTKKNGEPTAASSRRTYAGEILAAIGKLRDEDLFKRPSVKLWMGELNSAAEAAPVNRAPLVDKEEIIEKAMKLVEPRLSSAVKSVIQLMWVVMARSVTALKGLAWVGRKQGQWRFSWQGHKTRKAIGIKDVWISEQEIPQHLREQLELSSPMMESVFRPELIAEVTPAIKKALAGRNMSIRRSAAQMFMYQNPDLERLRGRTNHTNTKILSKYLATRPGDLRPHAPSTAKSRKTSMRNGKKR